jgi:hypothetical protein
MSQEAFDRVRGSGTFVSTENPNFASERSPRRSGVSAKSSAKFGVFRGLQGTTFR